MKQFFQKYLAGDCTEEEFLSFVELFVKSENRKVLDENMEEDWKQNSLAGEVPDMASTLHKVHFEINKQEQVAPKSRKIIAYITRVAAILLLPLAIAFFIVMQKDNSKPEMQTISTPLASKTTFELPDGSVVWLNSGSSLIFPNKFNGGTRTVKLIGEAYFDVTKSEQLFNVETPLVTVNVLGTAFNVMAYSNEFPEVTLERGKVLLSSNTGQKQLLKPGQQAIIDTTDHSIVVSNVETEIFTSWINNQLIFNNETFANVVKRLERWYNIKIEVADESLANKKMTANIKYESIGEVMELLEITLPIKYDYNKNQRKLVIIKSQQE